MTKVGVHIIMIVDNIRNIDLYMGMNANLDKALSTIKLISKTASLERVDIIENQVFYTVMQYKATSREDKLFEAHNKYIDVQYILQGEEIISYVDREKAKLAISYDSEKDIAFYKGYGNEILLGEGDFMILFPQDAHMPSIGSRDVKKVVAKVAI